jgi:hypothetical protein
MIAYHLIQYLASHSYSNYGGVSVKAEYSHEAVSRLSRFHFQVVIGQSGSQAGPSHHLNLCRTLWPVYPTTFVSFDRLLRTIVRESANSARRS